MILKVSKNKILTITQMGNTYEDENNAEIIKILLPQMINNNDIAECVVHLCMINQDNVGDEMNITSALKEYSENLYVAYVDITNKITYKSGQVRFWIKILNVDNEMVAKTNIVPYDIKEHLDIEEYIPNQELSLLDDFSIRMEQSLGQVEDTIKAVGANSEAIDNLDDRLDVAEKQIESLGGGISPEMDNFYTKEQADAKFTDVTEVNRQINEKIDALDLGTISKESADNYIKKTEATGYNEILTKTDAQKIYQKKGECYTKAEADSVFANSEEVNKQIDDKITELKLGTMSKETATDYVKKDEAVGYNDILTKTEAQGAYQAKGEYYTKSEADAAFTDSTEVDSQIDAKITALDLANTYQAKGDYATAKQGGKADSALQEITTTENGGLKVTNKNQIDIDENVVFIFDCGGSGVAAE